MTHSRLLLLGVSAVLCAPQAAGGQQRPHPRAEIPGFDFRNDGVWRKQARQIRANRARLLARRQFPALNAPVAGGGGAPLAAGAPPATAAAVSGVLRVPAILLRFKDTPAAEIRTAAQYDNVLFAALPPAGRPYTFRTFYEQMSNGLLSIQGKTYGYAVLDSNEVTYAGIPGTCSRNPYGTANCNGLFSSDAQSRMQSGLREALRAVDNQIDWTQYDSDSDGYVDLAVFIHPPMGGECGGPTNNHLWAHRFFLTGGAYPTHSRNSQGVTIKVSDYTLQSGVGGAQGCNGADIMPIGTVAHETGHGFGLPDLYDTADSSEGIGQWGLMGSGNYTSPLSPARMEAWSLSQVGWVTVRPLGAAGTYRFGAAPLSDTVFYVRVSGANSRGEYFLFENRQASQADTAVVRIHCQESGLPATCPGGLLVWHIDSTQVTRGGLFNTVNSGPIHGVALVQADGLGNLDLNFRSDGSNRGDAGDPFPGRTGNTLLSAISVPAARRNSDGRPAGIVVDQIQQIAVNGELAFRLAFPVTLARAQDTAAVIRFDGVSYNVYRETLDPGTTHSVEVADTQLTAAGRTRQVFVSWTHNGAVASTRVHTFDAGATPDTLIATLARAHRVEYTPVGNGTVAGSAATGALVDEGTAVALTATPAAGGGPPFVGWAGDTATTSASITLPMGRPYSVRAVFLTPIATAAVVSQLLSGTGLTPQQQADLDQLGNANGEFDVGDFLAWVNATGAPVPADGRALLRASRIGGQR
ncbi:MAG TPA: M6 family metalloprotease domain-containing protein [Gemmatimonadales bacterium]|nr:M6 family metalloprotease domain-containing protein [Gemmatimonadales bacterium]